MEKKWKNEWKWKKKGFGKINCKSREFVKVADLYLLVVRTTLKMIYTLWTWNTWRLKKNERDPSNVKRYVKPMVLLLLWSNNNLMKYIYISELWLNFNSIG